MRVIKIDKRHKSDKTDNYGQQRAKKLPNLGQKKPKFDNRKHQKSIQIDERGEILSQFGQFDKNRPNSTKTVYRN